MRALLLQWLKANRVMLINAGSLVGTTLVTGALGFAYWWVADRQFQPQSVGLASASISAMMLLGALCVLGLGTLLIGELSHQPGKEASLISTALILVGIVGGLGGIIFALIAPFTSADFLPLRQNIGNVLIFAAGVSLTAITIVLDQALIGLLYGGMQFWRNALFAAAKLVALFVIAFLLRFYSGGVAIYATWVTGNVISLVPFAGFVVLKKRALLRHSLPDWGLLRKLGLPALQHHILNLILQVPTTTLPVLVTILLSATTNAWFYTAWMITGFVFIAAYALTTVLYAINSAQTEELARKIRMTLSLAFVTSLGANIVLQIGAAQILGLFGHVYAEQATWSLRVLSLAAFPMIIKYHYIAVKRIDKQLMRALLPVAVGSILELGAATVGAHLGALSGLSVGWLVAVCLEAVFMSPAVFKAVHFKSSGAVEKEETQQLATVAASNGVEKEETRHLVTASTSNGIEKEETWHLATTAAASKAEEQEDTERLAVVSVSKGIEKQKTRHLASVSASKTEEEETRRLASGDLVETQQLLAISISIAREQGLFGPKVDRQAKLQRLPKLPAALVAEQEKTHPLPNASAASADALEETHQLRSISVRSSRRRPCPKCYAPLAANATFCRNCGVKIAKIENVVSRSTSIHVSIKAIDELRPSHELSCPQCNAKLPSYAKFCSVCGEPVELRDKKRSVAAVIGAFVTVVLPFCALILWALTLQTVHLDLRSMNDLGLVSIFPLQFVIALFIITLSFCMTLWQKQLSVPIILLHIFLLIFMLYGVTTLVEDVPRFAVVYRHAGYTDYIMRHGGVDPGLDAYFSWPGFFTYAAFLTKIAGYQSILPYAGWAPVFFNVIYLGPLYMIARTFTTDKRIVWLSLFFFYVTNWIAQDYISPQGLNFFMYLVMIAILVKWFKVPQSDRPRTLGERWKRLGRLFPLAQRVFGWLMAPDMLANAPSGRGQRVALLVCLIAVFGFMVFSHPLTPFLAIAAITALVVLRRCHPVWLPVVMIVMTAAWLFFMAQPYLAGNINSLIGDFTNVKNTLTENVTNRVVQGDAQHTFISDIRLMMTLLVWGLAFVGGILRLRKGYRDVTYVILAAAPFPVLLVQSYGGEMLLRIYLFTLPLMTLFIASIFYIPSAKKASFWMKGAVAVTCVLLIGAFLFTRYGNERMDYMTNDELAGVNHLYSIAPKGSYLLEAWNGTPWEAYNYEEYLQESLEDHIPNAVMKNDVNALVQLIVNQPPPQSPRSYIIFTRAQRAPADIEGLPPGTLDQYEQSLLASRKFVLVYTNRDVQILLYVGGDRGGAS